MRHISTILALTFFLLASSAPSFAGCDWISLSPEELTTTPYFNVFRVALKDPQKTTHYKKYTFTWVGDR